MVSRQIVSPLSNRPAIEFSKDALLAWSLLTLRDTFLDKDLVMNILMWVKPYDGRIPVPAIVKPKQLWTGKQIFSLLLPFNLNLIRFGMHMPDCESLPQMTESDTRVLIESGKLLSGRLDKKTVGCLQGSYLFIRPPVR